MLPAILAGAGALSSLFGQYMSNSSAYEQQQDAIKKKRKQLEALKLTPLDIELNQKGVKQAYNAATTQTMNNNAFNTRGIANKESAMAALISPLISQQAQALTQQKNQDMDYNKRIGLAQADIPEVAKEPINFSQILGSGVQGAMLGMELNKADLLNPDKINPIDFNNPPKALSDINNIDPMSLISDSAIKDYTDKVSYTTNNPATYNNGDWFDNTFLKGVKKFSYKGLGR